MNIKPKSMSLLVLIALAANAAPVDSHPVRHQKDSAASSGPRDEGLWKEALRIQKSAIVVDTHNDITSFMTDEDYDIGVLPKRNFITKIRRQRSFINTLI